LCVIWLVLVSYRASWQGTGAKPLGLFKGEPIGVCERS
jgi:hypothetical protein